MTLDEPDGGSCTGCGMAGSWCPYCEQCPCWCQCWSAILIPRDTRYELWNGEHGQHVPADRPIDTITVKDDLL